jgi:hypothetical protein
MTTNVGRNKITPQQRIANFTYYDNLPFLDFVYLIILL